MLLEWCPPFGCVAVTFHGCEVGPNIKHQSCLVLYGEQKCPWGVGQFYVMPELFTHLVLRPWFRMEVKPHFEKGLGATLLGSARVGYRQGVGFWSWFWCSFHAIMICFEMGHQHLASPSGVPEIWEPKNWALRPKWLYWRVKHAISGHFGQSDQFSGSQISGNPRGEAKC